MTLKTSLIATLSLALYACAGSPPKMERPVKFYSGSASKQAMCRRTTARMVAFVKEIAKHDETKRYAAQVLAQALAKDDDECIKSSDPAFNTMIGTPADDLRVLLQYQEELLYKCQKWAP